MKTPWRISAPPAGSQFFLIPTRNGYNTMMTLQNRIAVAADKLRKSGGHPHQVHLTKADAIQLQYELMAEGGKVAHDIMQGGIRKAVVSVFGLQIVWGSQAFQVV